MGRAAIVACALLVAVPAYAQQDSVAPSVNWTIVQEGDTVVVQEGRTLFVIDRPEINRLRVDQRNDSIRIASLEQARSMLDSAADSLRSALVGCRTAKSGLRTAAMWKDTVIAAEREARQALQDAQDGGLEGLITGPSGFVVGNLSGLGLGVLACRGANP